MRSLCMAACALALTLSPSTGQAKVKTTGIAKSVTLTTTRDHRDSTSHHGDKWNKGGGVRVYNSCRWTNRC